MLPAAGNATPATYELDGRQYVVIGAGGGKWGSPSGGTYVAFAIPRVLVSCQSSVVSCAELLSGLGNTACQPGKGG